MGLLTAEHLSWIGTSDPPVTVEISRRDIIKYATATEQVQQKYLRGEEAPPMFVFNLFSEIPTMKEFRADGLARRTRQGPALPLKRMMAGGSNVEVHRPIRAGDVLTAVRTLVALSEKEGRSGPLIFVEYLIEVVDQDGQPVMEDHQTGIAR
jgi:3-methylfumaryl-CoA hydratase